MDHHNQPPPRGGRTVTAKDVAQANDYFEHFLNATSLKNILGYYRSICEHLNLKPNHFPLFYPKLKSYLTSWRAKALWKKFDARAVHKCYGKGKLCTSSRVLIIGAGPCGLRTAIEAQLLGAKVVVVEKRDRLSRHNVLHLWPFVIEDLRALGAKKFFGKFCAGAIDHISIRQLQCILLKVVLLLGVEVHTEVSFERLVEPDPIEKTGWKAEFKPSTHPVSQFEFDVVIGADGKRNTLQGFKRKEFRGKLAIAITANFINKRTEAEARVEEISGVAFIFNQKFFKELYEATGIDLENIVYYKDETHYFVMTAKKPSLIEKGVIKQDLADTERLLSLENVNREALMDYAIEAANFSTHYQMPDLEFAVNHYGQPDVAMFDFTSMYAAENASKVLERNGDKLLMILVGDSLLEPFWPTGSGCARGFLSSLDAAWAIRSWCSGTMTPLDVLAERESIYRLLGQTTPDNLNKEWKSYTLEPATRYPNLNKNMVMPLQTVGLFDSDDPKSVEKLRRNSLDVAPVEVPKKRRRGNVDNEVLLSWIGEQVREHGDIELSDIASVFKDGKVLCAILNHYRPDLVDYGAVKGEGPAKMNQLAIDIFEREIGISPIMTGEEITTTSDYLAMATYLTQVYDSFRCEIPHIKHPKLELPETKKSEISFKSVKVTPLQQQPQPPSYQPSVPRPSSRHKRHAEPISVNRQSLERKTRKRRTLEKIGASVEERQKILEEIAANRTERQNKRRQQRRLQTEQFVKSMQMLQANAKSDLPFEDYSLFVYRQTAPNFEDRVKDLEKKFTYVPDYENKLPNQTRGNADEDFAARIKNLEDKWRDPQPAEKKPRDLLRAIGKIETSDWNIKEIEKKIRENKLGKPAGKDKEKVPKWSKEQFKARQTKMEKQHLDRQDSAEGTKFADIDKSIKHLDLKLKEGNSRELGQNKVASITEKLTSKAPEPELKPIQKSNSRPVILPSQNASEFCHFCGKRVYLMERLSAEGRFFHHGCFKCQYCNTQLRLGSYAFDRDGIYDHKFFCIHHYGMQGEVRATKVARKPSQRQPGKSPEKKPLSGIAGVDLLDRVQTPERIEFANLSGVNPSDHEESLSQMDEDEWTDKNFGASAAELGSSDDESSSLSDTDSDDEDAYEEALEEPATKEGTLKWAERFNRRYSKKRDDSDSDGYSSSDRSSYYENTSDDDDSDTATEGEEEIRARELRRQEVRVEPPVVQTDTGTDTEVKSSNLSTIPDILSDNHLRVPESKSPGSDDDSAEFSSAVSGCEPEIDSDDAKTKAQNFALAKSATAGALPPPKPSRNFILPPREKRKSFGAEFVPKFPASDPEPLLIIKRTPSKLNMPKEIGKPKVAVSANFENAKKYFGEPKPKPILKRSETVASVPRNKFVKQKSLPEKTKEDEKKSEVRFNFEPLEDSGEIDTYIENLLANEEELMKPIDPEKYAVKPEPESEEEEDDKKEDAISSSIEDLFKALKTETKPEGDPTIDHKIDEKIEDLLNWMDDLEHQSRDRKAYRSLSDAKYKNLERSLKVPRRADSVVSKLPKDNVKYFERLLAGKSVDEEEPPKTFALARSKTDVYCNKPRTSVDLDAVSNFDIKKVMMKFETAEQENDKEKEKDKVVPRRSFGKRFSLADLKKRDSQRRYSENLEAAIKDFESVVDNMEDQEKQESKDWCVNITVSTIPNPEYLGLGNFDLSYQDEMNNTNSCDNIVDVDQTEAKIQDEEVEIVDVEQVVSVIDDNQNSVKENDVVNIDLDQLSPDVDDNEEESTDASSTSSSETDSDEESEIEETMKVITDEIESMKEKIASEKDKNEVELVAQNQNLLTVDSNPVVDIEESLDVIKTPSKDPSPEYATIEELENLQNNDPPKEEPKKVLNIEDLYAKVNKPRKERAPTPPLRTSSPPVPRRNRKKSTEEAPPPPPPQRPQRQKSHDHPKTPTEPNNNDEFLPVAPQRKRANTSSPLPKHKAMLAPPAPKHDTKSRSTTNLEIVSDESTSDSSSEVRNSATEISTDSEFAHDDPTPTRELPFTSFNDANVTKRRGTGARGSTPLRKIQVTSGYLQRPSDKAKAPTASPQQDIELKLTPLVPSAPSIVRKTAPSLLPRTEGYALNRTQSTGGIAAKVSLELKKKYLLGESGPGSIQKSGSASTLDTKLRSFHSNITDCQKMLKPAPEVSAAMQTFCNKLTERASPILTPPSPKSFDTKKVEETGGVVNEPEGRPRSPVHETSIIVPKIDWSKTKQTDDSISTDSVSDGEAPKTPEFNFESIPTVRIDEIPPDSLCMEEEKIEDNRSVASSEPPKSITSEKKTLNQPKVLPELETKDVLPEIHDVLHVKRKLSNEGDKSGDSEADSIAEPTAALTETELSDWARDGAVSDDLGDDFDLNLETTLQKKINFGEKPRMAEMEELEHVCGKEDLNKTIITEALNSVLSKNLDIEFMDTGTETSSDDGVVDSQNGYVLFNDEDELAEDSLNPNVNDVVETKNEAIKNTGYCIIDTQDNFGASVTDLKPSDLEQLKAKQSTTEHDEDSLLIVEGTTTEENTCSDSTVKNLTEISTDKRREDPIENNNFQKKRLEEKLAKLKAEQASKQSSHNNVDNVEFDEHCQRLQSKFEFSNVKDSIDVRKSRRKSKDSPQKPDLIQEEMQSPPPSPNFTLQLSPTVRTPDVIYRKDVIEKERDVNQKLVQEMVMNKMKAENKSLERKRRRSRQFELSRSATTDVVSEINHNLDDSNRNSTYSSGSSVYATPDVLLSTLKSPESDQFVTPLSRPVSFHVTQTERLTNEEPIKENPSLPDVRQELFSEEFITPVAPPRLKHEEAKRTAEKLKQEARVRARLLSNEELGLSPEDKLLKLKEKLSKKEDVPKVAKIESFLHSTEALNKREGLFTRSKSGEDTVMSVGDLSKSIKSVEKICKSDPNLLDMDSKKGKKKNKDKERRKSITKLFTTFFSKKSPPGNGRGFLSRISPKAKDVSKDVVIEEPVRRNSFSEVRQRPMIDNSSPPPVPPLPLNYTGHSIKGTDDSSDGEHDWKRHDRSSCDTLDKSGTLDSVSSLSNNRMSKSARKLARQAQLKRHRMAQEIQRKLEETEVKTRELEERGVLVEKALRGEVEGRYPKEESELLQEWFDLMRDRTELRRYERELMVRAQELELEDRHARLQHELRERLENEEQKTQEEVEIEGSIINEMMEIVAKRDSLIALLEEDRLRCLSRRRDSAPHLTTGRQPEHQRISILACLLLLFAYIVWGLVVHWGLSSIDFDVYLH
ncbi:F-actin-monooxygenase Mical isoform X3 [Zophobas morio]|uniref:F-actin-monooxygenase Mical isoform X3 n=1 Tax=Zophobas morio TaxID=2755281 RepID=UPI00308319AF